MLAPLVCRLNPLVLDWLKSLLVQAVSFPMSGNPKRPRVYPPIRLDSRQSKLDSAKIQLFTLGIQVKIFYAGALAMSALLAQPAQAQVSSSLIYTLDTQDPTNAPLFFSSRTGCGVSTDFVSGRSYKLLTIYVSVTGEYIFTDMRVGFAGDATSAIYKGAVDTSDWRKNCVGSVDDGQIIDLTSGSYTLLVSSYRPREFTSYTYNVYGPGTFTIGEVPSQIGTIAVQGAGDKQVTVNWTAPADNGSPITKYTVTGLPGGSCTTEVVAPATEPATACIITGLTNGTPYKFTVVATNAIGDSAPSPESAEAVPSADLAFVGAAPVIALPAGTVGASYTQTVSVVGGLPPYTFVLTGELPAGLDFDTAKGMLFGTPTAPGSYSFTITASDYTLATGPTLKAMPSHQAVQNFTLQVAAAPVKAPTPVPTMGAWGGLLLSGLVVSLAGLIRRKKSA
ncbi:MAG: fibronectin type III domain-containing protein [Comamonas sp.]